MGNFHSSLKSAYILIYFKVLVFDFRCRGSAINYLVSVYSHRSCLDACNRDDRCDRYSYHGSDVTHPDQDTCYLFSSSQYDMEDLMFNDGHTLWRTGNMTSQREDKKSFVGPASNVIQIRVYKNNILDMGRLK